MFSTLASVQEYTGKNLRGEINNRKEQIAALRIDVDGLTVDPDAIDTLFEAGALIRRAQSIIEIYIGKDEIDIEDPADLILLDKMTAYQTAYMLDNEEAVFNQVAVTSQGQTDFIVNFNGNMMAPWIAPLAVIASKGLTFKKPKSIRTGKIFQRSINTGWNKN